MTDFKIINSRSKAVTNYTSIKKIKMLLGLSALTGIICFHLNAVVAHAEAYSEETSDICESADNASGECIVEYDDLGIPIVDFPDEVFYPDEENINTVNEPDAECPTYSEDEIILDEEANKDQIDAFVKRMYTCALSREAEEAGLNDWSNRLSTGQIDGAGLANGFIESVEFNNRALNNEQYLDVLYKTFFNREPDTNGKADWLNQLNNGTSREEVLSGFVNSVEFSNLCDEYDMPRGTMEKDGSSYYNEGIRDFVLKCYAISLERKGDTISVEDWCYKINKGLAEPKDVVSSIINSKEYHDLHLPSGNYNDQKTVADLYKIFFDRTYDIGGKTDWLRKLVKKQITMDECVASFAHSDEFKNILNSYKNGTYEKKDIMSYIDTKKGSRRFNEDLETSRNAYKTKSKLYYFIDPYTKEEENITKYASNYVANYSKDHPEVYTVECVIDYADNSKTWNYYKNGLLVHSVPDEEIRLEIHPEDTKSKWFFDRGAIHKRGTDEGYTYTTGRRVTLYDNGELFIIDQ